MAKPGLLSDFVGFIRHEKKWWMVPLLIVLVICGLLAVFATSSPLSPFLYTLF